MCLLVRKQEQILRLVWMIVFWGVKKVVFTFLMEVFLFLFVFYVHYADIALDSGTDPEPI